MKKLVSLFISIIALFTLVVSGTFAASAATTTSVPSSSSYVKTLHVTLSDINSLGASRAIQKQLDCAKDNAKDNKPYKVVIDKAGEYTLSYSLRIYSNTTLVLTGVTLIQDPTTVNVEEVLDDDGNYVYDDDGKIKTESVVSGNKSNMLKVGDTTDTNKGYYYKNIYIKGGTFDENGNGNTCMKIAHATNVTIEGVSFQNVTDGHFMEIAGVNGLTIKKCNYKDQKFSSEIVDESSQNSDEESNGDNQKLTYEAIQLDILESSHFNGYLCQDLANKNITITGCTFDNVPRGIGSHTAVLNNPMNGLTITGNTFTNITNCAIHVIGCKNVTISDNDIGTENDDSYCPRGIAVYSYQLNGTFLASKLADEGGVKTSTSVNYETPTNANIVIKDNRIFVTKTAKYGGYENVGISVEGIKISSGDTNANDDVLPTGVYYLTGVTIENNKITANGHGIRLSYAKKAVITSNKKIVYTGTNGSTYYGISLTNSSSASSIDKNIVSTSSSSKKFYRDLYLKQSTVTKVSGNKFYKSYDNGISLEKSTVSTMSTNTVDNAGKNGIYVYKSSTVKNMKSNTIKNPINYGVSVENSKVTAMTSNTINTAGVNGIYINSSSTVDTMNSNTIRDAKKYGISIEGATVTTMQGNVVARSAINDIYVTKSSTVTTLTSNTSKNAKKYGISIEGAVAKTVSANKITSSGNTGIRVSSSARVSNMDSNNIQSAKGYGIDIENATCTNITSNTISKSTKTGINVSSNGKTKVKKIASNIIKNGSSYGIHVQSIKCAMTVSKNTISECSGSYMLYINPRSKDYAITISSNKITGTSKSKGSGIYVATGDISIKSNTVQTCKQALVLSKNAKGSIYDNTFKSNGDNNIVVGSTDYSLLTAPVLTASTTTKSSIKIKWKKLSSINGYEIYRSTSKNGTYTNVKTVSSSKTVSYTDKGLKTNKKYYYKAMSYKKVSNFKIYSPYSDILNVSTKK